jgi:hypothetical protein
LGTVTILPLARRVGLVKKIADRLQQFERAQAPGAADKWWRNMITEYEARAKSWGVGAYEIDRQLRGLHHAVRAELHRRSVEASQHHDRTGR